MSDERHPTLERLFAEADRELADERFVAGVMQRTSALNGRRLVAVLVVVASAVLVAWLGSEPLGDSLLWLTRALSQPLAGSGEGVTSPAVLPMNTVGGALAVAVLALRAAARRLFSAAS
jgi:hypothetical protein